MKNKILNGSNYLNISITNWCNLNCSYCYKKNLKKQDASFLTKEQIESMIYELRNQKSSFPLTIFFSGGEPLLYNNYILAEIINNNKDIIFQIVTNGTIPMKTFIHELKHENVTFIVSYDGEFNNQRCGIKFENIKDNITYLTFNNYHVHINPTYNHLNVLNMLPIYFEEIMNKNTHITYGWNLTKFYTVSKKELCIFYSNLNFAFKTILEDIKRKDYQYVPFYIKGLIGFKFEGKMQPHCQNGYRKIIDVYGNVYPCNIISQNIENRESNILNGEKYKEYNYKLSRFGLQNASKFYENNIKDFDCGLKCMTFSKSYKIINDLINNFLEDCPEIVIEESINFFEKTYPPDLCLSSTMNSFAFGLIK